jgi:hypothetical protein
MKASRQFPDSEYSLFVFQRNSSEVAAFLPGTPSKEVPGGAHSDATGGRVVGNARFGRTPTQNVKAPY